MLVSLTVGKVDAGVAVLLTQDNRLVSSPSGAACRSQGELANPASSKAWIHPSYYGDWFYFSNILLRGQ